MIAHHFDSHGPRLSRCLGAALLTTLVLTGCAAGGKEDAAAVQDWELTLHTQSTDNRFTYFEVDRQGRLYFGGGRQAMTYNADLVAPLTPAQREQVWNIIEQHKLLKVDGHMFGKGESVTYELTIASSQGSARTRLFDDDSPGVKILHDTLFEIQADHRYHMDAIKEYRPEEPAE